MGSSKGMVSGYRNALRDVSVDSLCVMFYQGCFPVHNFASVLDSATKSAEDCLPAENQLAGILHFGAIPVIAKERVTYWPIQTPRMGILPAKCLIHSILTPESVVG